MDVVRIALLGIVGVMLCILLKESRPEYSLYVSLAAGICILAGSVGKASYLLEMVQKAAGYLPVDFSYVNTLLKMIGIAYVGQFAAGISKDAGFSSIAGQIEVFSRLSILAVSMPILLALLETIQGFLA